MLGAGWGAARSLDMDTIYKRHLDAAEKARAERLEVFDEFEEWHMIQVSWTRGGIEGWRGGVNVVCESILFSQMSHKSCVCVPSIFTAPYPIIFTLMCPAGALLHHRRCQRRNH